MSARPQRILIVEDDDDILDAVRHALVGAGFEVFAARDGAEGLMRVERDAPDLLLLDVVMPKRSGFSVLDRLKKSAARRNLRIILMTANDRPEVRDFAASHEVDAFVPKPFDIDELVATAKRVLDAPPRPKSADADAAEGTPR